jgi:rfaE bifunctional protein kinase chain/domain
VISDNENAPQQRAFAALEAAHGRTVIVFGDLMLDEWIIGHALRISPEGPVPVVRLTERKTAPGGAANVAMNLLKLGAQVRVCGLLGDDEAGADLERELREAGADTRGLVRDATRPTTLKTRVVAQRQQMIRIDRESDAPLDTRVLAQLAERLEALWDGAAALCLSDYDKGLITSSALERAVAGARARELIITGGPKPANLPCFARADFLSLNRREAAEAVGGKLESDEAIAQAGTLLQRQTGAHALVITCGERGFTLFSRDEEPRTMAAHAVEVFDVAGAGDTFLAASTVALAGGADFVAASELGNLAAAASVRHVGVVAVSPDEIRRLAAEK